MLKKSTSVIGEVSGRAGFTAGCLTLHLFCPVSPQICMAQKRKTPSELPGMSVCGAQVGYRSEESKNKNQIILCLPPHGEFVTNPKRSIRQWIPRNQNVNLISFKLIGEMAFSAFVRIGYALPGQ